MAGARYEFDQTTVAQGGYGKVFKGHDNELERPVAIKQLAPLLSKATDEDRERFRREAKSLAKLSHPSIPAIYDVHFTDDEFYIIFEYIDGPSLHSFIHENGQCSLSQARTWFRQLASAVQHAHDKGVIHRDIKPGNIMLSPDLATAVLVDFGLALNQSDGERLTPGGFTVGTVGYMSPEQEAGDLLDNRTDIYSLSVTLYESLCGRRPSSTDYRPLSTNESIPLEIDDLVSDGLGAKDSRVQTAKAFGDRLAGILVVKKPLADVLTHGQLHNLAYVLESMDASEFAALPAGQRHLILEKVIDLADSSAERLLYPAADMIELLVTRAALTGESYREIVELALHWGFDKEYDEGRFGRRTLRSSLADVAGSSEPLTHRIIQEEVESFYEKTNMSEKEDWYLHELRMIIGALMANSVLTDNPVALKKAYREINRLQKKRV